METNQIMEPQESRAEETRLRIFENTLRLVETEGVANLTVRKIASASNVSPALIIQYFHSKDRLLFLVYAHVNADVVDRLRELEPKVTEGDMDTVVNEVIKLFLQRAYMRRDLTRYIMSYSFTWEQEQELRFREWIVPLQREIGRLMIKADPSLGDDEAESLALLMFIQYGQFYRVAVNFGWSVDEAMANMVHYNHVLAQGLKHRNA